VSERNVEVVRLMWAGLNEGGMSWLELCDEGYEIRNPPDFPVRGPYRGHEGARQWFTEIWEVFSELRHEVEEIVDAGDGQTVVSVQRTLGRMRHTRLKSDVRWATVWIVRAGKVVSAQGYWKQEEAFKAAGMRK
jgi:ketosteroid isomerase-like protein